MSLVWANVGPWFNWLYVFIVEGLKTAKRYLMIVALPVRQIWYSFQPIDIHLTNITGFRSDFTHLLVSVDSLPCADYTTHGLGTIYPFKFFDNTCALLSPPYCGSRLTCSTSCVSHARLLSLWEKVWQERSSSDCTDCCSYLCHVVWLLGGILR